MSFLKTVIVLSDLDIKFPELIRDFTELFK